MKVPRWLLLATAAPLAVAGCGTFGDAMTAHTDVLARAAGHEFRVEDAAQILANNPDIPVEPSVVRMLADVWVDYTLLATAVAEDTSLAVINLDGFTQEAREQRLIMKLRDEVIRPDTNFTDEQIAQAWVTDGPGAEIRARHILFRIPSDATPPQRDSIRTSAEQVQARAVAGEDFAELARQYSQDPGSAARGGDLDYFGRGRMVQPFEEAAFALETGEISEVVESPFGYHVIRLEDRRQPEIGADRDRFLRQMVQQAEQQAEERYLDSLSAAANVQVRPGGLDLVRELAQQPDSRLRGRAAGREIATYQGGNFTSAHFQSFIQMQPPHIQSAVASATDEQLEGFVQQLARKDILVREAQQRGIELTADEQQEITSEAREAIRGVVEMSGFLGQANGGPVNAANVGAEVRELLEGALRGERQLVPLGPLSFALRQHYPAEVNESAFNPVMRRTEQLRADMPANGTPEMPQQPMPQQPMPQQPMPGAGTPQPEEAPVMPEQQ